MKTNTPRTTIAINLAMKNAPANLFGDEKNYEAAPSKTAEQKSFDTQRMKVLNTMLAGYGITSLDAFENRDADGTRRPITRLSAIIHVLRKQGYEITNDWQTNGKSRWVCYRLAKMPPFEI